MHRRGWAALADGQVGRAFSHIGHRDSNGLVIGAAAVADAHSDVIDIVGTTVGRRLKIRRTGKGENTSGAVNSELGLVSAANKAEGERRRAARGHSRDGGAVFGNADTGRGTAAVAGNHGHGGGHAGTGQAIGAGGRLATAVAADGQRADLETGADRGEGELHSTTAARIDDQRVGCATGAAADRIAATTAGRRHAVDGQRCGAAVTERDGLWGRGDENRLVTKGDGAGRREAHDRCGGRQGGVAAIPGHDWIRYGVEKQGATKQASAKLAIGVVAYTFDGAVIGHCAGVLGVGISASADSDDAAAQAGEADRNRAGAAGAIANLGIGVVAPTLGCAIGKHGAGIQVAGAKGGDANDAGVYRAGEGWQVHRVAVVGRCANAELALTASAPAFHCACCRRRTGMIGTSTDCAKPGHGNAIRVHHHRHGC